jgi:hypothetical protein
MYQYTAGIVFTRSVLVENTKINIAILLDKTMAMRLLILHCHHSESGAGNVNQMLLESFDLQRNSLLKASRETRNTLQFHTATSPIYDS